MRLYTKKRQMKLRVPDLSFNAGYVAEFAVTTYIPTINFAVQGNDGIKYYISLSDADIKEINEARATYDKYFKEQP